MFAYKVLHVKTASTVGTNHVSRCSQKQSYRKKDHNISSTSRILQNSCSQLQLQSSFSLLSLTTITKHANANMLAMITKHKNNNHENSKEELEKELIEAMKCTNEDASHVSFLVFLLIVALGFWSLDDADADSESDSITKVNNTDKETLDSLIKEGIAFMNSRKYRLAIEAFNSAILVDPNNVVAHTFKAACHVESGDYLDAIQECDIAQKNDKSNVLLPRIQFFKGIALSLLGRHMEAIECFTMSVMKSPHEFPTAFTWIAKSFCAVENYGAAYGAVVKGLKYSKDPKLIRLQGMLQIRMKKYSEAVQAFDIVLAEQPKDIVTWVSKGIALFGMDDTEGAVKCFDKAVELYPKCALNLMNKVYALHPVELEIPKEFMYLELKQLCG